MASLICCSSSLAFTKANTGLQRHQKPNSLVSFPIVSSQARDESKKSLLPLFSPRTSTTATKVVVSNSATTTETTEVKPTPIDFDQTVEHIVFLQMRDPAGKDPEETRLALKTALNSLRCLPGTLYLSAGYVGDIVGAPSPFNFFLHSRLATQKHRDRFMQHPLKYGFSMGFTEGLCDDFMMLDFIHKHEEPLDHPEYGSQLRFVFLKIKDGVDEAHLPKVFDKNYPGCLKQLTFGRIIEPCFTVPGTVADAVKGFTMGIHATFHNKEALYESFGTPEELAKTLQDKLGAELVDDKSIFVHDYKVDEVYGGTFL